jgi:predicted acetyltransferase
LAKIDSSGGLYPRASPVSARIIEKGGGVLEDIRETAIGPKRRYWVTL